jgi:hypothetical protein
VEIIYYLLKNFVKQQSSTLLHEQQHEKLALLANIPNQICASWQKIKVEIQLNIFDSFVQADLLLTVHSLPTHLRVNFIIT